MTEPPSRPASTLVPAPSAALAERRAKLVSRGLREAASLQVGQLNPELIERFFDRVKNNDVAAVRQMLERDPSLIQCREPGTGTPALHCASSSGNMTMATLLLDFGASISARDSRGHSALSVGVDGFGRGREMGMLLLDRGADPNESWHKQTLFDFAVLWDDVEMVQRLLEKGLNLRRLPESFVSPLAIAASFGKESIAKVLLDAGADPNDRDDSGETVLHSACIHLVGSPVAMAIIRLLIDRGADVNAENERGETPLHCAVWMDNRAAVELLLAHGADQNRRNRRGQTPADAAVEDHHEALARWLRTL